MTPQSLRDPRADAAAVDPTVELTREYRSAMDRLNTPGEISDDDSGEFLTNVTTPLEVKLARTRPTTREGIIAVLGVAARETRDHYSEPLSGTEAMVVGVIENARDALKGGVSVVLPASPGTDDPFPAWLAEWEAVRAALKVALKEHDGDLDDRLADRLFRPINVLEKKINDTPAYTIAGVVAKLRVIAYLVEIDNEPSVSLVASALAGAEYVMRGPGVVATGPNPLFALWSEWREVRATPTPEGLDGDEADSHTAGLVDRMIPLEVQILNAPAQTLIDAYAQIVMLADWEEDGVPTLVGDNGLKQFYASVEAALQDVATQGVTVNTNTVASPDPMVALWEKWRTIEWRRPTKGLVGEEEERFNVQSAGEADEAAIEIVSASPETLVGLFAQMAVLKYWAENAVPDTCKTALGRLYGRIEATLQDAVATAGGSS